MSKLNTKRIQSTTPKKSEFKLSDGNGLFLRVRPSGAKSWLFCFRLPGDRRVLRMTLGSISDLSLKEARSTVPELRKLVCEGVDPRNARAATKTENAQAISTQILFNSWIEFMEAASKVSAKWIKRHKDRWRLHLRKSLANILAKDITRAHLAAALDTMTRKGIKEETRKTLTTLNLMLDYGLTRHLIEHNHARLLKPKDFAATANSSRDRALTLSELRKLWLALDNSTAEHKGNNKTSRLTPITANAIKLLILTGARRGEVAAMRWDELDLELGVWSLAATRTKNKKAHIIYLSALAINILKKLNLLTGHSLYVFNTGRNTGHIHTDSLTTAINRLRKTNSVEETSINFLSGLKQFTIHDLRRSAATAWGEYLKVNPHIIERMLNHQPHNKLIATYQRATYANEQKAAWQAWGEMIEHQLTNTQTNIIPIKYASNG